MANGKWQCGGAKQKCNKNISTYAVSGDIGKMNIQ